MTEGAHLSSGISDRWLVGGLVTAFVALSMICLVRQTSVGYDPSLGLLAWSSMGSGAAFNHVRMASANNLAADQDTFLAMFSPGQYCLPAILNVIGIRIGRCLTILEVVCIAVGLWGYYRLYARTFKFSNRVALLACGVILLNRQTLHNFSSYSGGPLLLFSGLPYFLITATYCLRKRGLYLAMVPIIFLFGAFMKLSFTLVALAIVGATILGRFIRTRTVDKQLIIQSLLDVGTFCLFYGLLNTFYTSKGWTASHLSIGQSIGEVAFYFCYSLAGLVSGVASIFWSFAHLGSNLHFLDPGMYKTIPSVWLVVLVITGISSTAVLIFVLRKVPNVEYCILLLNVAAVHVIILTGLFLNGGLIAEDRHFWPGSAILLPGLIYFIATIQSAAFRRILSAALVLGLVYGVLSFGINLQRSDKSGFAKSAAISFPSQTQEFIDLLEGLDAGLANGRNVFFFTEPSLALLIHKNAVLVTTNPQGAFESKYGGHIDRLILILPESLVLDQTAAQHVVSSFLSSRDWKVARVSNKIILYSGDRAPDILASQLKPLSRF